MGIQHVELEERRRSPGDERVPWPRHRREQRGAAYGIEIAPGEPAHHGHPEPDDQYGEHADEPLGEHSERDAQVEEQKPRAPSVRALGVAHEAVHREGETEHEELIGRRLADVEGVADHRRHDEPGQEPRARPVEASPDPPGEEHRAQRPQRRPEPRRPLGGADEPEGQRRQPEIERGLLEIR